jgi:methylmalonyl-CoA/ethylmalonyl-CoA epimerase
VTALCALLRAPQVSEPQALPQHGVTVVFVDLPNTRLELLEPLGLSSPVAAFLERNKAGGIHHICLEVDGIEVGRPAGGPRRRRRRPRRGVRRRLGQACV